MNFTPIGREYVRIHKFFRATIIIPWTILALCAVVVLWWSLNRVEPLVIIDQTEVPSGRPGEQIRISASVMRDSTPPCSLVAHRYVVGKMGYRYIIDELNVNAETLAQMTKQFPGMLKTSIVIPMSITPGPAKLVSYLRYHCNPLDAFWPIETVTELHFTVLPP